MLETRRSILEVEQVLKDGLILKQKPYAITIIRDKLFFPKNHYPKQRIRITIRNAFEASEDTPNEFYRKICLVGENTCYYRKPGKGESPFQKFFSDTGYVTGKMMDRNPYEVGEMLAIRLQNLSSYGKN